MIGLVNSLEPARRMWRVQEPSANPCSRNISMFLKHGVKFPNNFNVVVPTGFEPVSEP